MEHRPASATYDGHISEYAYGQDTELFMRTGMSCLLYRVMISVSRSSNNDAYAELPIALVCRSMRHSLDNSWQPSVHQWIHPILTKWRT